MKLFQIDWDLTFAILFINADKTVYARYGTRNGRDADDDVAIEGLASTMRAVLEIHKNHSDNLNELSGKQPVAMDQSIPEDFQALDHFNADLDYQGKVAKSCIHCHQIRDAARLEYRTARTPMPQKLLYPFPSPRILGLDLDPRTCSTVADVAAESAAATAGLEKGDIVNSVDGQSVASEADVRWLLHNWSSERNTIELQVTRGQDQHTLQMELPINWRSSTDLSWRPTTWDLRRMATGGMTLVPLTTAERELADVEAGKMALRAEHVGKYGNHAREKKAGIQKNDVIVSFDGREDLLSENALIEHAVQSMNPDDTVELRYLRDGRVRTTRIKLQ